MAALPEGRGAQGRYRDSRNQLCLEFDDADVPERGSEP
jgi:hypothetical protein